VSTTLSTTPDVAAPPPALVARRRRNPLRWVARPQLATLLGVAVVWEVLGRLLELRWLPPVTSIAVAWWDLVADGSFLELGSTVQTLALGLAVTYVAAALGSALLSWSSVLEEAAEPFVNAALATPTVALVPVYIMIWGFKDGTRVATVISFALFPVLVTWLQALKKIPDDLVEMGRAFTAGRAARLRRIVIPAAAPMILTGVRLGVVQGIKGVVTAEVLVGIIGIGRLLQDYTYDLPHLYAVVLTMLGASVIAYLGLFALEERLTRRTQGG
jgi:ABC-type nitrate/sulfonate/bicarbonate transport system permease component